MIHKYRGKAANEDTGKIREFPYKDQYTYLGLVIDRNLTMRKHLEKIKDKVEKGRKILYMCNKRNLPDWPDLFPSLAEFSCKWPSFFGRGLAEASISGPPEETRPVQKKTRPGQKKTRPGQ